jgi:DNA replication protein DnaC
MRAVPDEMAQCEVDNTCRLLPNHAGPCTSSPQSDLDPGVDPKARQDALNHWRALKDEHQWCKAIPGRYYDAVFDDLNIDPDITEQLANWIGRIQNCETNGSLILFGGVGTGKTWTATAVLRELQSTTMKPLVTSSTKMLRKLRPEGGGDLDDYIKAHYLLIDDLGAERGSEWVEETLYAIIDERWREARPTIITTNLVPADLKQTVGDRIYDRRRDDALAITLTGPSRRKASVTPIQTPGGTA